MQDADKVLEELEEGAAREQRVPARAPISHAVPRAALAAPAPSAPPGGRGRPPGGAQRGLRRASSGAEKPGGYARSGRAARPAGAARVRSLTRKLKQARHAARGSLACWLLLQSGVSRNGAPGAACDSLRPDCPHGLLFAQ